MIVTVGNFALPASESESELEYNADPKEGLPELGVDVDIERQSQQERDARRCCGR
jgi:hypothetical protein